ncbi:MAG TPA: MtrB/PioB family decaheme-associated outer membrane protein [Burkholderiales bacterium]|nr:MtrB/PioB family decaheme-associated outer membrane protein [Burkholderiales bacterium]
MDTPTRYSFPIAVALLAGLSQAAAASDEAEIQRLITPESEVSLGLDYVGNNNQYWGEYTGLNQRGVYGSIDADVVKRDNETGTWYKLLLHDLALDDREMRAEVKRQGDWGVWLDYSEIPRYNPFTITTGLNGIGTGTNVVNGTFPRQVQFETNRERFTLDLNKLLPAGYDFELRYSHEDKTGERQWGQQAGGANPVIFLADPISYTTQQVDAILRYTGEKLQVSGGYYGTWFQNENTGLTVSGFPGVFSPMSLPPDNSSHQANLTAGYNFTPFTRGTFKAAYTYQIQDENFVLTPGFPLPPANDLQGDLNTTLVQAGLTSQILPKLSGLADIRYENRSDNTPIYVYTPTASLTSTTNGTNEPRDLKTIDSKLQASYLLPANFRFTGSGEYVIQRRNEYPIRSVSYRYETDDLFWRGELRRAISETVTGALTYVHESKWGSPFLINRLTGGAVGSNDIEPLYLANRSADTVKLMTNWTPVDALSFQIYGSGGWVNYGARNQQDFQNLGLQSGWTQNYGADATYVFTEKWQANAWYSRNDIRVSQITCSNAGTGATAASSPGGACNGAAGPTAANPIWEAELRNVSNTFGIGTKGKVTGKVDVDANIEYTNIVDHYPMQDLVPGAPIGATVPNINTQIFDLRLTAKYAFEKNMGFRFNYIYNKFKTNDWTWTSWTYADGTTVTQNPNQVVNFIGVAYYFTFQ